MHYLAARLQWNIDDEPDRILDEFHRDCFGNVATEMRAYHDACERYWTRTRPARWFEGLDRLGPEEAMADLELLREAQQHLNNAYAKAESQRVKDRIRWLRRGFDFTTAIRHAFEAKKADASPADRVTMMVSAARSAETAHRKLAEDPAYKHSYYQAGGRFERKCWGWFKPPVTSAAISHWEELRSSMSTDQAQAEWKSFERRSRLGPLLKRREWTLDLPESPN
jgi:hypothetical protein